MVIRNVHGNHTWCMNLPLLSGSLLIYQPTIYTSILHFAQENILNHEGNPSWSRYKLDSDFTPYQVYPATAHHGLMKISCGFIRPADTGLNPECHGADAKAMDG